MIYIFYTVHVIVCLFLILVVLLQQGKGADLSVFGGGSTQAAFGARGAATLLHKLTVGAFIAFIVTTMGIGFLQTGGSQRTVMDAVAPEEAPVAESGERESPPAEAPGAEGEGATAPLEAGAEEGESAPPTAPVAGEEATPGDAGGTAEPAAETPDDG